MGSKVCGSQDRNILDPVHPYCRHVCLSGRCCNVRIHDLHDLHQIHDIVKLDNDRLVSHCEWTDDGQLVGVASWCGSLCVYLTQLPIIGASYRTRIAYLTSLQEITLHDATLPVQLLHCVSKKTSPTFSTVT